MREVVENGKTLLISCPHRKSPGMFFRYWPHTPSSHTCRVRYSLFLSLSLSLSLPRFSKYREYLAVDMSKYLSPRISDKDSDDQSPHHFAFLPLEVLDRWTGRGAGRETLRKEA